MYSPKLYALNRAPHGTQSLINLWRCENVLSAFGLQRQKKTIQTHTKLN